MTSDIEIDADEMEAIGDEIEPPTTMDWVHNYVAQHGHLRSIELGRAKLSGIDLSGIDMRNSVIRGRLTTPTFGPPTCRAPIPEPTK